MNIPIEGWNANPIFRAAEESGWTIDDVASAICDLAVNHQLGKASDEATDAMIAKAMAGIRKQ